MRRRKHNPQEEEEQQTPPYVLRGRGIPVKVKRKDQKWVMAMRARDANQEHTQERPFCRNHICPCHYDKHLILQRIIVPRQAGLLSDEEATALFMGVLPHEIEAAKRAAQENMLLLGILLEEDPHVPDHYSLQEAVAWARARVNDDELIRRASEGEMTALVHLRSLFGLDPPKESL